MNDKASGGRSLLHVIEFDPGALQGAPHRLAFRGSGGMSPALEIAHREDAHAGCASKVGRGPAQEPAGGLALQSSHESAAVDACGLRIR
jgi:hypothetical protein